MAKFNEDVPKEQLPHYWNWSKAIPQPSFAAPQGNRIPFSTTADTSKGAALTGIGDILGSGAKAADAVVDSSAKFEAEQASREERAKRTLELQGAESILAGEQPDQEKINGDLAPLNILKQARANGHLSDTDYWMRVDARLSDIRSRYPVAYRDDIDQTSTKILGENAANATVRSRTADINASLAAAKTQQNKAISRLDKAIDDGLTYAADWKKMYLNGGLSEEQLDKNLSGAYAPFFKQKLLDAQVKALEAEGKISAAGKLSADSMNGRLEDSSRSYWDHYDQQTGMNASKADSLQLSAQEAQQRAQWVAVQEAQYRQRAQQIVTEPRPELGGRSYLDVHGKTDTDAAIDRGAQRFKIEQGILTNNDFGSIHRFRKTLDAANTDMAEKAFGDPLLKDYYLKNTWATKELGQEQAKKLFEQAAPDMPEMVKHLKNIDTTLRFGAQPGEPVRTVQKSFEQLSTSKIVTPSTFEKVARTIVDVGLNPKSSPEAVSRAISSVYDPTNSGFMGILTKNSQLPMFNMFTNKPFTELVRHDGTPQQNRDMVDWTNTSFKNMVGPDVKSLGDIQNIQGVTILWHRPEANEAPRFGFTIGGNKTDVMSMPPSREGAAFWGGRQSEALRIREVLQRINGGLSGLYNVYNGDTANIERTIFETLQMNGFNPEPSKVQNLPEALANSILATRAQEQRSKATVKELSK